MYNYKFIEHTADIAVELEASTIDELFICAADAWKHTLCDDKTIASEESKKIELQADSLEELLVNFLSEINYLFLTKKWFCVSMSILTVLQNDTFKVAAELEGSDIANLSIQFKEEIKAVTYHQLKIEKQSGKYTTRIIFDI